MTRMLLAGFAALALAGCGGSSVVGANSTESTEITAVGNLVATPAPPPFASATPDADNVVATNTTAAVADDAGNSPADVDDAATAVPDDHATDEDGGADVQQH